MSTAKTSRTKKEVESKMTPEVKPESAVETKPDVVEDGEDADDSQKVTFESLMAVSYTHLTLPTILRV